MSAAACTSCSAEVEQSKARARRYYSHWLTFTREFISGTLAGLTHEDGIPFCSHEDAAEWVRSVSAKPAKVGYKIVSFSIEVL